MVIEKIKNDEKLEDCTIEEQGIQKLRLKFSGKCIVTLNDCRSRDVLVKETENAFFVQKVGYWLS